MTPAAPDFTRTPVVVHAHLYGEPFWSQYCRLVEQVGKQNVYLLWDVTRKPVPDAVLTSRAHDPSHIIPITEELCRSMNRLHRDMYTSWSALLVHVANCLSRHTDWDYFWKIEYDVACCGHWRDTLALGNRSRADLLGTHIEPYGPLNRSWCHWGRLTGDVSIMARTSYEIKGFFPVMRISRDGIRVLQEQFNRSDGYIECYLATVLAANGCTVEALPREMFGVYFNAVNLAWSDWLRLEAANRGKNTLVHPVKIHA